ncbi:MAG: hypothetical protein ABWW69_05005 [Pyrodictiaceae archaeon]
MQRTSSVAYEAIANSLLAEYTHIMVMVVPKTRYKSLERKGTRAMKSPSARST